MIIPHDINDAFSTAYVFDIQMDMFVSDELKLKQGEEETFVTYSELFKLTTRNFSEVVQPLNRLSSIDFQNTKYEF